MNNRSTKQVISAPTYANQVFYEVSIDLTPARKSGLPALLSPAALPRKPSLQQIQALERLLLEHPQVEMEPNHYFAPGMYGRELFIPAGSVVVGKLHRHTHLILLTKGEATVWTDEGMQRIKAPRMWVSSAGTKRALYTHEDCIFVTVHATDETDLDALEAELIVPEFPLIEGEVKVP